MARRRRRFGQAGHADAARHATLARHAAERGACNSALEHLIEAASGLGERSGSRWAATARRAVSSAERVVASACFCVHEDD
jgi:hypothetical protein